MSLPNLGELWERLADYPKLGDVAEIHRGVEWNAPPDGVTLEEKYVSHQAKPGFKFGLHKVTDQFLGFVCRNQFISPHVCRIAADARLTILGMPRNSSSTQPHCHARCGGLPPLPIIKGLSVFDELSRHLAARRHIIGDP